MSTFIEMATWPAGIWSRNEVWTTVGSTKSPAMMIWFFGMSLRATRPAIESVASGAMKVVGRIFRGIWLTSIELSASAADVPSGMSAVAIKTSVGSASS